MGYSIPAYFKLLGFTLPSLGIRLSDIPYGLAAVNKVPGLGWKQIIFFADVIEGKFESEPGLQDYTSAMPREYGWKVIASSDLKARNLRSLWTSI